MILSVSSLTVEASKILCMNDRVTVNVIDSEKAKILQQGESCARLYRLLAVCKI